MEKSKEFATPEISRRRTSAELPSVFPELQVLNRLSEEEIAKKWHLVFFDVYAEADNARKKGNHKAAIVGYRKAQALVDFVDKKDIEDELILVRDAYLHYSTIQSYANFQTDSQAVMREFHNFGEALYDFLKKILGDDKTAQEVLQK